MSKLRRLLFTSTAVVLVAAALPLSACAKSEDVLVLRVANWEEYIDLGGWDENELIGVDNPYVPDSEGVFGENSMINDFTDWFNSRDMGFKVKVEYSTFGTNEDLYNRLNLNDTYDLICPSDYLIMQLLNEDKLEPYSPDFYDTNDEYNYYTNNVSSFITDSFDNIEGYELNKYAACYMWGTTGIIYNPDYVDTEDVSSWSVLKNPAYKRAVTIKDNVRDSYFAALGVYAEQQLENGEEIDLNRLMNEPNEQTIAAAEAILKDIKENVYSFETDSGKADMITGKVWANFQWSGDAVYIMDQADSDESNPTELWYSYPDCCTNLWFDGWVMLKSGINGDDRRKTAAEAFVNFLSRPDNAIRNSYYIGYTSSIAGDVMFDYFDWNYGATLDPADEDNFDPEMTSLYIYDVSYFFGEDSFIYLDSAEIEFDAEANADKATREKIGLEYGNDAEYTVYSQIEDISRGRQAFTQYPPYSVAQRGIIMKDFGEKLSDINQMWINVRCLDVKDFNPAVVWSVVGITLASALAICLYVFRYKIFIKDFHKKGYELTSVKY